jgi:probable F420-dependent oxidoreductase
VVLAKELATLDYPSGGRVILGVGVGWLKEEFDALGVPFDGRGRRAEESIAAMRSLWRNDRASFDGVTTNFKDCYLRPQPPHGTIPIHIGGHSRTAARRAGRIGDGYFPFGVSRDDVVALVDIVKQSALEYGRDPRSIEVTMDSYAVSGEPALADVMALKALGATRVLIPATLFGTDPDRTLHRYADEVIARI